MALLLSVRFARWAPAGALVGALALGIAPACSPGELHLLSEASGGDGDTPLGSGGLLDDLPGAPTPIGSQGGANHSIVAAGIAEPPLDPSPAVPCLVTRVCDNLCEPGGPGCGSCDATYECPYLLPLCDASFGACVECLDDHDCEARFGRDFDECSAGRCVQCQKDDHCSGSERCDDGWCGRCDGDRDCDKDEVCYMDHCTPGFSNAD